MEAQAPAADRVQNSPIALVSLAAAALYQAHEEKAFLFWMRSTNHLYTGDEYQARLGIYLTNSRLVQEHNAKCTSKAWALVNEREFDVATFGSSWER